MESHGRTVQKILAELEGVLLKTNAVDVLSDMIEGTAQRKAQVFLHGVGREGLMIKGFAMRLFHLGLNAHCIGDMTTPPITSNDLLILSAGPGSFSTVKALASVAKLAGGTVAVLTAQSDIVKTSIDADTIIAIPAQTMANSSSNNNNASSAPSVLPMGSLYEGAMFLVFEMCILRLREKLQISPEEMRSRHTNLE